MSLSSATLLVADHHNSHVVKAASNLVIVGFGFSAAYKLTRSYWKVGGGGSGRSIGSLLVDFSSDTIFHFSCWLRPCSWWSTLGTTMLNEVCYIDQLVNHVGRG